MTVASEPGIRAGGPDQGAGPRSSSGAPAQPGHVDAADAGEGTRARTLRAAAALSRRQGFDRTTRREIADVVGLTTGSCCHHLRGRQALVYEIIPHTFDRALPAVDHILSARVPAAEPLRHAVRLHVRTLVCDRDNVARAIEEARLLAPADRDANLADRDRHAGVFRRIAEDGIGSGEFAPTDGRLAGSVVPSMVNRPARWHRPDGGPSVEESAARFVGAAVGALADTGGGDAGRRA